MTNYSDLVKNTAATAGVSQREAAAVLKALTIELTKALNASDGKVRVPELGTFTTTLRPSREYKANKLCDHNVTVPAHYAVKFEAAKALKDTVAAVKVK